MQEDFLEDEEEEEERQQDIHERLSVRRASRKSTRESISQMLETSDTKNRNVHMKTVKSSVARTEDSPENDIDEKELKDEPKDTELLQKSLVKMAMFEDVEEDMVACWSCLAGVLENALLKAYARWSYFHPVCHTSQLYARCTCHR